MRHSCGDENIDALMRQAEEMYNLTCIINSRGNLTIKCHDGEYMICEDLTKKIKSYIQEYVKELKGVCHEKI